MKGYEAPWKQRTLPGGVRSRRPQMAVNVTVGSREGYGLVTRGSLKSDQCSTSPAVLVLDLMKTGFPLQDVRPFSGAQESGRGTEHRGG